MTEWLVLAGTYISVLLMLRAVNNPGGSARRRARRRLGKLRLK